MLPIKHRPLPKKNLIINLHFYTKIILYKKNEILIPESQIYRDVGAHTRGWLCTIVHIQTLPP